MERADLTFQPFNEHGEVRIYYNGFLPHWRQKGCTYFVTWRLADSIPSAVLRRWKRERAQWLEARQINVNDSGWLQRFKRLSANERKVFERAFASKLFTSLDQGHGDCVLREPSLAGEAMSSVLHFHGTRLDVGDVVIMPNHVHALLAPYDEFELEDILHSIKSYSSNQIQQIRGTKGKLWMKETHDHIVRDGEELLRCQSYIRENPEKAGLKETQFQVNPAQYDLQL